MQYTTSIEKRRDFLRIGSASLLGLSLADLLRLRASATTASVAKSCILIWLDGGPSHLDSFDPKPHAPAEVRGPFSTIPTSVPGVRLSELLPQTAKMMDQVAIIRSMTSPLGEHNFGTHYLLTGYKPTPALNYPSHGSVVAGLGNPQRDLPANIAVPNMRVGGGNFAPQGFLSGSTAPFEVGGDPSNPSFKVQGLDPFAGVTHSRLEQRNQYLRMLDQADATAQKDVVPAANDISFEDAYRLMTSASAKAALDLSREPQDIRARYGAKTIGQSCLLARRLVEAGVPFVTVNNTGWDTHNDMVTRLKEGYAGARVPVGLIPSLDQALTALVADLSQSGRLSETLIVVMGEFGRTPKLNPAGGRDHWPRVFSVLMAGAGITGGQIVGASDAMGESPHDRPVSPADLAATMFSLMGIDPDTTLATPDGRPVKVSQGQIIRELSKLMSFAFRLLPLIITTAFPATAAEPKPPITAIAFAPDGTKLVVGSQAGLEIRDWPTLEPLRTVLSGELQHLHDVAFSPDGTRLLIAGGSPAQFGQWEMLSWPSLETIISKVAHDDVIYAAAWSDDGLQVATVAGDKLLMRWNVEELENVTSQSLPGHSRRVLDVAYLPRSKTVITASVDQSLRIWMEGNETAERVLDNHTAAVHAIAVRPGPQRLPMVASAGKDRTIRLWQPTIGRMVRFLRLERCEPLSLAWTEDGDRLCVACSDGHLRVIDPNTVQVVADQPAVDGWAHSIAVSSDNQTAVVGGERGELLKIRFQ